MLPGGTDTSLVLSTSTRGSLHLAFGGLGVRTPDSGASTRNESQNSGPNGRGTLKVEKSVEAITLLEQSAALPDLAAKIQFIFLVKLAVGE
jgi:hypothetical protein